MSTIMRLKLTELEQTNKPIKVGIIGAGFFGVSVMRQVTKIPGIDISIVADLVKEKAIQGYVTTGHKPNEIAEVKDVDTANHFIEKRVPIVTSDSQVLIESDVDVVLEATGSEEAGARHAYHAMKNKKHVVMATVEAEVVVGPLLAKMAEEEGVVYSMAYGDQPAVIVELYDWAISSGFRVVAAGEGTAARLEWRHLTPDDALPRFGWTREEIERLRPNSKMFNSFIDTTKCAVEMTAVCNATGLKPDIRGMHFPSVPKKEMARVLSLKKDGGILESEGVTEVIPWDNQDGRRIEDNIRWGVFVVVTSEDREVMNILGSYGGSVSGNNALIFRPYHLAGLEASISLIRAALFEQPTGAPLPSKPIAEVITAAKKDLKPGDVLDGSGGYTVYGLAEEADIAKKENLLPLGFADGIQVIREISRDKVITYDDVKLNEESFLSKLRQMQDATFH